MLNDTVMKAESQLTVPVAFIIFNRPDTAAEVFKEIKKAKPKRLYLISDAARDGRKDEAEKVRECRETIEAMIDWDCEVRKNYAETNMGCKMRVSSGISWALEHEEYIIILEDDVVPSEDFFSFMQQMLEEYKDKREIFMVSGTNLIRSYVPKQDYIFSNFPSIWGWGTWKRAWAAHYDVSMSGWKETDHSGDFRSIFRNPLAYWLFRREAYRVYNGEKDTWDVQWDYCRFRNHALGIVPRYNMVRNIGFNREDATHTTGESFEDFSYGAMKLPCKANETMKPDDKYEREYLKKNFGLKRIGNALKKKLGIR